MKLLLLVLSVFADLPLHCLVEDVVGTWTLHQTGVSGLSAMRIPACGHFTPNDVLRSLRINTSDFGYSKSINVTLTVDTRPSAARSWGEELIVLDEPGGAVIGSWTLVFDEGFEVRFDANNERFFAHFQFSALNSSVTPHNGDQLDNIGRFAGRAPNHELAASSDGIYECDCGHTTMGWHSTRGTSFLTTGAKYGCFYGEKVGARKKTSVELLGTKKIVKKARKGISALAYLERRSRSGRQVSLPASFDWRNEKELEIDGDDLATDFSQGACGSCYAFAATLSLTMRFRIALARKFRKPAYLDLSWRHAVRCSPYTEGCAGGFPYLIGRVAMEVGSVDQNAPAGQCRPDTDPTALDKPCDEQCLALKDEAQMWFARDYGYVGGYAQGASDEMIMRELYERGPVCIELSVHAIPELVGGQLGNVISSFDNSAVLHDSAERGWNTTEHTAILKEWMWVDHALLSVGWGSERVTSEQSRAGIINVGGSGTKDIIAGTPMQLSLAAKQGTVKWWTLRNSWGRMWGNQGYGRLIRGVNAGGIEISAVWIDPDMNRGAAKTYSPSTYKHIAHF